MYNQRLSASRTISRKFRLRHWLLLLFVIGAFLFTGRYLWREKRWRYIVIHHTASDAGNLEYYKRIHQTERGWPDIAYHFVVNNGASGTVPGQIEVSDLWRNRSRGLSTKITYINYLGIAVVMVGNLERHKPSTLQYQALVQLLANLSTDYKIPVDRMIGHRELQQTACPGKHLDLEKLRQDVSKKLSEK